MRTMQRAFQRACVGIRHTEGFNPHAYISVALPLSVGVESVCELLDFEVVDGTPLPTLPALLTTKMPEGIAVTEVYEAERKVKDIAWLRLAGTLEYDALADTGDMASRLAGFFGQRSISVAKQTKKKEEAQVDIAPLIREIALTADCAHRVRMEAVVAAQNPGLGPSLLLDALRQNAPELAPDFAQFSRVEVYDAGMDLFR